MFPSRQYIMTERLDIIFSELAPCRKFADVGCDHGYIAEAMLAGGKAKETVVSDISAPSLEKAKKLLARYGKRVKAIVCDGLCAEHSDCDQILIAGMGGEEIASILQRAEKLPERLVLQPMKNADKVRKSLLSLGYRIIKDYVFKDGKYYFLIVAERGEDEYTEDELFFGRDNLNGKCPAFEEYAREQIKKYEKYLAAEGLSESGRAEIEDIIERYKRSI